MLNIIAFALQAAAPQAAPAPTSASDIAVSGRIERGMPVVDLNGDPVGHVAAISEDTLLLDTGSMKVAFAPQEFQMRSGGLVFNLTKAEVELAGAEIEQSIASSRLQLLKAGVPVVGADGVPIGKVNAVEPGFLVVDLLPSGMIKMPDHSFAGVGNNLVVGTTLAQIREIVPLGQ